MLTIFLRTVMIYLILIIALRIMGKRQIGELEISELITTLMLSELATLPIANQEIPLLYAVIPIILLLTFEVCNSMILIKIPKIKNIVSAKPSVLIRRGELNQRELSHIRMSIDELIGELRRQGISSPADVDYAILEQNGKLTVIERADARPLTAQALGLSVEDNGLSHIIIADGYVNRLNLSMTGHDEEWLSLALREQKCSLHEVFLLMVDDADQIFLVRKENGH